MNQRNAFVTCEVSAQPDVSMLYWIIDHNGTTLVAGQIVHEHWTLVLVSTVCFHFVCFRIVLLFSGKITLVNA